MSDTYVDFEGPVTMIGKYIIKPEYVKEYGAICEQFAEGVRSGRVKRVVSNEYFQHDTIVISVTKFSSAEDVAPVLTGMEENIMDALNNFLAEAPEVKFFATNSITNS